MAHAATADQRRKEKSEFSELQLASAPQLCSFMIKGKRRLKGGRGERRKNEGKKRR